MITIWAKPPTSVLQLGRKMDFTVVIDLSMIQSDSQINDCSYIFATISSVFCFLHWCVVFYWNLTLILKCTLL